MAANLTQWCLHNTTYYDSNPDISGVVSVSSLFTVLLRLINSHGVGCPCQFLSADILTWFVSFPIDIAFHVCSFRSVLLTDRSWQDAPIALWTFIATSAGLTLAAIVQRSQLSLFEALQVSNLVW